MRPVGQIVLALLAALWFVGAVSGCEVIEQLGEDDSAAPSNPTPEDIVAAALAPKPAQSFENKRDDIHCPGSFASFKKVVTKSSMKPDVDDHQWHHIVNQNPTNKKRFGNRLHCTDNLIALPRRVHQRITAHFNSKPDWTKGQFVRDVINKRSWRAQYEYGLQILRKNGVTP